MPYADPVKQAEYNKAYLKEHYRKNRQYYIDKSKRRRKELADFVNKLKEKPCMDCGVEYPYYVMDFDHRDSGDKINDISTMVIHSQVSRRKLIEEISKCDLVCSNCHRRRTHERRIFKL